MKIIITKRFRKEYTKKFKKYFTLEDLAQNLRDKKHTFINLHSPFFKVKHNIDNVNFRSVVCVQDGNNLVPLFLFLKKDKKFGENISWRIHKDLMIKEYEGALEDLVNEDFDCF